MKKRIALMTCIFALMAVAPVHTMAQKDANETMTIVRKNSLESKKAELEKRIAAEDRKREQHLEGVSRKNMEILNLRQDSICLQLRSELTDVELELKELERATKATPAQVLQQAQEQTFRKEVQQALKPGSAGKTKKKQKQGKKK